MIQSQSKGKAQVTSQPKKEPTRAWNCLSRSSYVRKEIRNFAVLSKEIFVNMEKALFRTSSDEYVVKVAPTVEEACKLTEVGFEHITVMDGKQLFRKRK